MIIKITNYAEGIHEFDFSEPVEKVGLGTPFYGDVKLNVRMDRSHSQIVFVCDVWVSAELNCDRCARNFKREFQNSFVITYIIQNNPAVSEDLNVYYISPETDKVNLKDDVREYVLLAVPMKNLCDEECKGLCPRCGKNLNEEACECTSDEVNPVWAELLKLRKKED